MSENDPKQSGKRVVGGKTGAHALLASPGESVMTRSGGHVITIGNDSDEPGTFYVTGKNASDFLSSSSFEQAWTHFERLSSGKSNKGTTRIAAGIDLSKVSGKSAVAVSAHRDNSETAGREALEYYNKLSEPGSEELTKLINMSPLGKKVDAASERSLEKMKKNLAGRNPKWLDSFEKAMKGRHK